MQSQRYETWDWSELIGHVVPSEGRGSLYVANAHPGSTERHALLHFEAWPWDVDGRQPVYWQFHGGGLGDRPYVILVAGPDVLIQLTDLLRNTSVSSWLRPSVEIIRVQDGALVPAIEGPFHLTSVIGRPGIVTDLPWFGAVEVVAEPERSDLARLDEVTAAVSTDPEADFEGDPIRLTIDELEALYRRQVDHASVSPRANGVTIRQKDDNWVVKVTVPSMERAAFAYAVEPLPLPAGPGAASRFVVRTLRTENAVLEFADTKTWFADEADDLSTVFVRDKAFPVLRIPPKAGLEFATWQPTLEDLDPTTTRLSARSQHVALTIELAVGFIPIVGSVVDVGNVVYMAYSGKNMWGESVSNAEVVLAGALALFGLVFEVGGDAFKALVKTSGVLFPGKELLKANPGPVEQLIWTTMPSLTPSLLDAGRRLPADEQLALSNSLYRAVRGEVSAAGFTVTLHTALARAGASGDELGEAFAERIHHDVLVAFHPSRFDAFGMAGRGAQRRIVDLHQEVLAGGRSALDLIGELKALDVSSTTEVIDEFRITRMFGHSFEDILDVDVARAYAEYRDRKIAKIFGSTKPTKRQLRAEPAIRDPIDWATQLRKGRAREILRERFGPDFRQVLERYLKAEKYVVTPAAVARYRALVDAAGNIMTMDYDALRKALHPYGVLWNADHILEQRFFKNPKFDRFGIDLKRFSSLPVPYNHLVARQMTEMGVPFAYVHVEKTRLLNRLIPNGTEPFFSLQEIYDAYVIAYVHQLKVGDQTFLELAGDIFEDLRAGSGSRLDPTIRPFEEYLRRWPFFRRRLS